MTMLAKRLEIAEAKAAAIDPASTMSVAELKARLAEVRAELARAWGIDVEGGLEEFADRLNALDHPGAAQAARITQELARSGAI